MKKSYSKSGPKPGYPSWEVGRRTGNGGFSRAAVRAGAAAAAVGRAKKEASEGAAPSDVVRPTDCELRRVVSLRERERDGRRKKWLAVATVAVECRARHRSPDRMAAEKHQCRCRRKRLLILIA